VFNLSYSKADAVDTDTEDTMISADRHLVSRSLKEGGKTKWWGCFDHLLQLVTQAKRKLLGKQVESRAVKSIQDATTRWRRTYSNGWPPTKT
jgi:hypothetical protein